MAKWSAWSVITTLDDADYLPVLDDVGPSNKRILTSNAAKRFAPQTKTIPGAQIVAVSGVPAIANVNRRPVMAFDTALNEVAGFMTDIPYGWSTFHVDFWWANQGAGAGNVAWRFDHEFDADTDTLGASPTAGTINTVTALAQNVVEVTSMATSLAVGTGLLVGNVARIGPSDTLANDAGLLAVVLTRAS